jgi:hypothetical protein
MVSCISWSNDFSPSATDWVFYKYLGLTVRNLSLRRTSPTCDSGSPVVCFLIASLRCCRKVRGFSLGNCCKTKLLFYIDTWHSGEQVSVSSLEEWGIWSRLNYFLPLWDGWSDMNASYLSYYFFWFSNLGELNPGFCTCWADIFLLSYFLSPKYFFVFGYAGFELRALCLQSGTLLLEPYHQPLLVWICQGDCLCPCQWVHVFPHFQVPWVLGFLVNGNHFQPEWPGPEPIAFLMQ